jgi:hypothetical protein
LTGHREKGVKFFSNIGGIRNGAIWGCEIRYMGGLFIRRIGSKFLKNIPGFFWVFCIEGEFGIIVKGFTSTKYRVKKVSVIFVDI